MAPYPGCPYHKSPTILGTLLGPVIFGIPHVCTVDSTKLEHGRRMIYASFIVGFGLGGRSYSNFLAFAVGKHNYQYHFEVQLGI